eukprot:31195-Pelagococcus_subviridis.AAC.9
MKNNTFGDRTTRRGRRWEVKALPCIEPSPPSRSARAARARSDIPPRAPSKLELVLVIPRLRLRRPAPVRGRLLCGDAFRSLLRSLLPRVALRALDPREGFAQPLDDDAGVGALRGVAQRLDRVEAQRAAKLLDVLLPRVPDPPFRGRCDLAQARLLLAQRLLLLLELLLRVRLGELVVLRGFGWS